jgi:hypothetical protein
VSVYAVEREDPIAAWTGWMHRGRLIFTPLIVPVLVDCNARDGEWPAFITLPHEYVEFDGRDVPLFEGDVERREWEARRHGRR